MKEVAALGRLHLRMIQPAVCAALVQRVGGREPGMASRPSSGPLS